MKNIVISLVLLMFLSIYAAADGIGVISGITEVSESGYGSETDDITIQVLNTFQCGYSSQILGMDYYNDTGALVFVNNDENKMYVCNPDDGSYISELDLDYAASPDQFGVCIDSNLYLYFNDWDYNYMHWYDMSAWHIFTNPVGDDGRGMDFDGEKIWETHYWTANNIVRFDTGGSNVETYETPEITVQQSGLTVFPFGDDLGVAVTTYSVKNLYFYKFDGSSLVSLGFVNCPMACTNSLGLAYSETRNTFFWSYQAAGSFYISELDIDITPISLEPATWAGIKADWQ